MTNKMTQFTGTKIVLAKAMSLGEYNTYRGWDIPKEEDPSEQGYLIEYISGGKPNHADHEGYISWSPACVFKDSYKPSETWLDRLRIERDEVKTRLDGLDTAVNKEKPENITEQDWLSMFNQQFHMRMYHQTISDRIARNEPAPNFVEFKEVKPVEEKQGSESNLGTLEA